jgi:hypothetical protein
MLQCRQALFERIAQGFDLPFAAGSLRSQLCRQSRDPAGLPSGHVRLMLELVSLLLVGFCFCNSLSSMALSALRYHPRW